MNGNEYQEGSSNSDLAKQLLRKHDVVGRPATTLSNLFADSLYGERIQHLMRLAGSSKYQDPDEVLMKYSPNLAVKAQDRFRSAPPPRFNTEQEVLSATLYLADCRAESGDDPVWVNRERWDKARNSLGQSYLVHLLRRDQERLVRDAKLVHLVASLAFVAQATAHDRNYEALLSQFSGQLGGYAREIAQTVHTGRDTEKLYDISAHYSSSILSTQISNAARIWHERFSTDYPDPLSRAIDAVLESQTVFQKTAQVYEAAREFYRITADIDLDQMEVDEGSSGIYRAS